MSAYTTGSIRRHPVSLAVAVRTSRHDPRLAWLVVAVSGDTYYASDRGVEDFDHVLILSEQVDAAM